MLALMSDELQNIFSHRRLLYKIARMYPSVPSVNLVSDVNVC